MKLFLTAALCLAFTAPVWAADAPPVQADVAAHYAIYGGGMHLIDADLNIKVDPKTYNAQLNAHTRGFLEKFFPWFNDVHSRGNVRARDMQPMEHVSANSWLGKLRSVTLIYDGKGGFVKKSAVPPPDQDNREEVAPALTENTMDVMSAALTLLQRVTQGENCNQTIAVYDGRRRFNLKFVEVGPDDLPATRYGIYSGPARQCDMTIERVAGYWKKFQTEWTEDGDAKMKVSFWLAPLRPGGPVVPVRARTYGQFGTVFVHLTGGVADGENIEGLLVKNAN